MLQKNDLLSYQALLKWLFALTKDNFDVQKYDIMVIYVDFYASEVSMILAFFYIWIQNRNDIMKLIRPDPDPHHCLYTPPPN